MRTTAVSTIHVTTSRVNRSQSGSMIERCSPPCRANDRNRSCEAADVECNQHSQEAKKRQCECRRPRCCPREEQDAEEEEIPEDGGAAACVWSQWAEAGARLLWCPSESDDRDTQKEEEKACCAGQANTR